MNEQQFLKKLSSIRGRLMLNSKLAFLGSLALTMKNMVSERVPTAMTNGVTIFWNMQWCSALSDGELMFVYAHEISHKMLMHPWRRNGRNMEKWNIAADYCINGELVALGFQMPKSGLYNPKYAGMYTEQIYNLIPDSEVADLKAKGFVVDLADAPMDAPSEVETSVEVRHAVMAAKARGDLPSNVARMLGEASETIVNYRAVLWRFIDQQAKNDYSWSKANRRFVHKGIYLPSLHGEEFGVLVIGIDTSGSVTREELSEYAKDVQAAKNRVRPSKTYVLYIDAKVQHVDVFSRNQRVVFHARGGGGTSFVPLFDWVRQNNVRPACVLYFTDMMGKFPTTRPKYPVLWLTKSRNQAPFGETIRIRT